MSDTTQTETDEQKIARLEATLGRRDDAIEDLRRDNAELREHVEEMEAKDTPLTVFVEAVQTAHVEARHQGHWEACPHPVCRTLEAKVLDWRKGGME